MGCYFANRRCSKYCSVVRVSVCLSVRSHILKTAETNFTKFLCQLPVAVARSASVGVTIRYVLPVLWMTSWVITRIRPKLLDQFRPNFAQRRATLVEVKSAVWLRCCCWFAALHVGEWRWSGRCVYTVCACVCVRACCHHSFVRSSSLSLQSFLIRRYSLNSTTTFVPPRLLPSKRSAPRIWWRTVVIAAAVKTRLHRTYSTQLNCTDLTSRRPCN